MLRFYLILDAERYNIIDQYEHPELFCNKTSCLKRKKGPITYAIWDLTRNNLKKKRGLNQKKKLSIGIFSSFEKETKTSCNRFFEL